MSAANREQAYDDGVDEKQLQSDYSIIITDLNIQQSKTNQGKRNSERKQGSVDENPIGGSRINKIKSTKSPDESHLGQTLIVRKSDDIKSQSSNTRKNTTKDNPTFAKCTFDNCDEYEGEVENDRPHGIGVYSAKSQGYTHKGKWINGLAHGYGLTEFSDHTIEAIFFKGQPLGHCVITRNNGLVQRGIYVPLENTVLSNDFKTVWIESNASVDVDKKFEKMKQAIDNSLNSIKQTQDKIEDDSTFYENVNTLKCYN
ncbi:hypothetical protein GJ496_002650 [Pomphorhynchus laevis]|nr:hypothetical protein GJ496_002650 [Pomphorhynchus laevis]